MSKVFLVRMVFLCHSSDPALHSIFAYAITQCHIYTLIGWPRCNFDLCSSFRGYEVLAGGSESEESTTRGTISWGLGRADRRRRGANVRHAAGAVASNSKAQRHRLLFFNSGKIVWRRRLATILIHHEIGLLVVICGHGNRQRSGFLSPRKKLFLSTTSDADEKKYIYLHDEHIDQAAVGSEI
jgi:hypothetical protein